MDNSIFKDEVSYWDNYFTTHEISDERIFELAFFKIFVKFELFVSEIFVHYCIGSESVNSYCPARKLNFLDRKHFDSIVKSPHSNYIDYFSKMYDLAPHIFQEPNSPFEILNSANYYQTISNMRIIRNYIAHESNSSRSLYSKKLLNGRFLEPHEFLLKKKKNSNITNYTYFINCMSDISDYLLVGPTL